MILVITTLILSACAWKVDPEGNGTAINDTGYFDSLDLEKEYSSFSQRIDQPKIASGAGMFLFRLKSNGWLLSYDPLNDRANYFCFDPACTHPVDGCVAKILRLSDAFVYYEGYFYFAYISNIVSQDSESGIARVSLDGSEMKVLYKTNSMSITTLKAGGGYLYIQHLGQSELHRYDLRTGKYDTLDHDKELYNGFIVTDEGLILHGAQYVYAADYDLKNKTPLFDRGAIIYADKKIYHLNKEYAQDGESTSRIHFYEYDMITKEDRYLHTENGGTGGIHCVDGEYLYYSPKSNNKQYITGGVINRIDLVNGESKKIFEDSRLEIDSIYSIDGKLYAGMKNVGGYQSWLPGQLQSGQLIFGKLIDEDKDGLYEFLPFEWDITELGFADKN